MREWGQDLQRRQHTGFLLRQSMQLFPDARVSQQRTIRVQHSEILSRSHKIQPPPSLTKLGPFRYVPDTLPKEDVIDFTGERRVTRNSPRDFPYHGVVGCVFGQQQIDICQSQGRSAGPRLLVFPRHGHTEDPDAAEHQNVPSSELPPRLRILRQTTLIDWLEAILLNSRVCTVAKVLGLSLGRSLYQ